MFDSNVDCGTSIVVLPVDNLQRSTFAVFHFDRAITSWGAVRRNWEDRSTRIRRHPQDDQH